MKVFFTDLLGETREIFSEQPPEVRQAMEDVSNFIIDVNVNEVSNEQQRRYYQIRQ